MSNNKQLTLSSRIIKCECIDGESLADIKLTLITARDTYRDVSERFPESILLMNLVR